MTRYATALALAVLGASPLLAQNLFESPVLETTLNATAADTGPHLADDNLTMHFASFRSGNWEIYSSTRATPTSPWGAPVLESALGGSATDDQPFLASGGLEMWFSSNRTGSAGGFDIMVSTRSAPGQPWSTPAFAAGVNSSGSESAPSLTADGLELVLLTTGFGNPSGNNNSIYLATRASTSAPFGTPTIVPALSNANTHRDVNISPDGLTITYTEFVPAPVSRIRVFQSRRLTRNDAFGAPVALSEFDTVGTSLGVYSASPSANGLEMMIAAGFATAAGGQEIMTTRLNGLAQSGFAGVTAPMALHFRDGARPGAPYALVVSLGNTGVQVGSLFIPVDLDVLFVATLGTDLPPFTAGFAGLLDANGIAQGSIGDPPAVLTGATVYVAGASVDPSTPSGIGVMSSAIAVRFQNL